MIRSVLAVALLVAPAASAMAAEPTLPTTAPAAATTAASNTAQEDRFKLVCHSETVLGSHIPRRVCMSKADAETRTEDAKKMVNRLQSFGFNCTVKGC
jgi:hypothetical protein